ncbi:hypothetical protein [Haemophilus sp. SZY H51]|uniref:hypothetical protein n=1 Tax=Haemophilus sp. SZY H51 TaxID=3041427 RepID=UPI0025B1036A|nr:hypothetical protein [Haemophilus sp. SZY H51]MDN3211498.1 hypothetical protein [Haemophilus sp. SZY H51]
MRFSTYINNQKSIEWGLNASQAALFDLLNQASSWAGEIVIDGAVFYWVSRGSVIQELPLFYSKSDTVYRHFVDLSKKGLIVYLKHGEKDLIRLTEKGKTWNEFKTEQIRNSSEIDPTLGNKSEETRIEIRNSSEIDPTDNNTNYKNTTDHNNKKNTKKSESDLLAEFGIVGQLAEDFIAHRKAKKGVINQTQLNRLQKQADKAGISICEAVEICIERNWQGFNASWDWRDEKLRTSQAQKMSFEEKNALPWNRPEDWENVL